MTDFNSLRQIWSKLANAPGRWLLRQWIGHIPFTIISNDCYGAELYRWLGRPYNTPFVGLMIMAPCYIKLLSQPRYLMSQPLRFTSRSKYPSMIGFHERHGHYPIGLLEDLEIHFLHYASQQQAVDAWTRRLQRMDWEHIKVKFSMDKDLATEDLLQTFEALSLPAKLTISKRNYATSASNIVVPGFELDAARTFRKSLLVLDLKAWLMGKPGVLQGFWPRLRGRLLFWLLVR
jgi:uncharacterized protein (DUF1919 family)